MNNCPNHRLHQFNTMNNRESTKIALWCTSPCSNFLSSSDLLIHLSFTLIFFYIWLSMANRRSVWLHNNASLSDSSEQSECRWSICRIWCNQYAVASPIHLEDIYQCIRMSCLSHFLNRTNILQMANRILE